jgi:hypothetical protein
VDNNKAGVTWHMLSLGASRRGDVIDTNSIHTYHTEITVILYLITDLMSR